MPANQQINTAEMAYATALVDLAEQAGALDATAEEMADLGELLAASADVSRVLSSHTLTVEERAGSIDRAFKGRVSDLLYRFLQVVNRKGRLAELPGIIRAFAKLYAEKRGIAEVDIHVPAPMGGDKLRQLADRIGSAIGKQVVPHEHVDAHLLGGLKLRIGDKLIDGSVATQLRLMRDKLVAAGREKARG